MQFSTLKVQETGVRKIPEFSFKLAARDSIKTHSFSKCEAGTFGSGAVKRGFIFD